MQPDAPVAGEGVPACFTSARQYRAWKSTAARIPPGQSQYCADCTPLFQGQRIRESRCGFPGTTFHLGADGFVDGVRPGCRAPNRHKPAGQEPSRQDPGEPA